jgi:DNA-nicking Smr family endonuclease
MLVSIGTKVQFRHSGETGTVIAMLENNMVRVHLDHDDMDIPAFTEDLIHITQQQEKKAPSPPTPPSAPIQGGAFTDTGVSLAFDPTLRADASAEKFDCLLLNDTPYPILADYQRTVHGRKVAKKHLHLDPYSGISVDSFPFDELNEGIRIQLDIRPMLTDGTGPRHHKEVRLKPKAFFKSVAEAPILGRPVHLYLVFPNLATEREETSEKDSNNLRTYTKENIRPRRVRKNVRPYRLHEVEEFAHFEPELDLHIEKLVENAAELTPKEILQEQMAHFERYLDQAIRLGIERVFIIHGLGKGKLRQTIQARLRRRHDIREFRNEYHPRYGYGATEVVL